jgi:5-methylcytosine-specific restriction endonuclease McrA
MTHPSIRQEVQCSNCGNCFTKPRSDAVGQENHFCDRDCFNSWHTGKNNHQFDEAKVEMSCDNCGKLFERYRSKISESNFCSKDCKYKFSRKDGFDGNFYHSSQWERRRKEIRNRDDNSCVWCGEEEKELHVHHLRPISAGGSRLDKSNLVTLCQQCHVVAHQALSV